MPDDWKLVLSQKQLEIMQECRKPDGMRKLIFINGPKFTGKTVGCENAVADHAWNTNGARIAVIAKTVGAGDDCGVWTDLCEKVIPHWISGGFGMDWWYSGRGKRYFGPRQKSGSKKLYCELRSKFGTKSHIQLESLQDERDVEGLFFNRYFTMIYWCEVQQYLDEKTFKTLNASLRMTPQVPEEQHVLLCDGNPSDLGEQSWQWKKWFQFRTDTEVPEDQKAIQKNLRLILVYLEDNPFLSEARKAEIRADYASNPDLYARYVEGRWVKASSDALFAGVFQPSVHVIGDEKSHDPDILMPSEQCIELITSWDLGSANPAIVMAEKIMFEAPTEDNPEKEDEMFQFIDELVFVRQNISVSEITEMVVEKMEYWEKELGRKILWRHWSDTSSFDHKQSIAQRSEHEEVYLASGRLIELRAVEKGHGSVARAIRLWRKLLFQDRLRFSAAKCPKLIEMNQSLKRKKNVPGDTISDVDDSRHVFDAARYLVSKECWESQFENILVLPRLKSEAKRLVSVPL